MNLLTQGHEMSDAPTDGTSGSYAHGVSSLYRRAAADIAAMWK